MPLSSNRIIPTSGAFGVDVVNTSGLRFGVQGGTVSVAGRFSTVANTSVTLTDSTVNFVELDDAGVLSVNAVAFTAGRAFLYEVTTSGGRITAIQDWRNSPNVDAVTALAASTTAFPSSSDGTVDLLSAVAATRQVVIVTTVTEVFADGDGAQPTFTVGEESGSATKFADASVFTGATRGTTFTFAGTLTSGKRLQAYATAGTGTTETGALSITVHAVG